MITDAYWAAVIGTMTGHRLLMDWERCRCECGEDYGDCHYTVEVFTAHRDHLLEVAA